MSENGYIFGSSDREFQRLYLQSLTFENETTHTLRLAGIEAGMECLDMGSGFGDTTFLMSKLVGRDGKVLGMDAKSGVH